MVVKNNMEPRIILRKDTERLAEEAAVQFIKIAKQSIKHRGVFSVALAGGSTPRNCYKMLAEQTIQHQISWKDIHLFWGDERNVPHDHIDSNYRMVREELLDKITIPGENIHPFPSNLKPEDAVESYENEIRRFFQLQSGQFPKFDLILLGMGIDGHTASLFPNTAALKEKKHLAYANYVEAMSTVRFTLTIPVINNARIVIFLISGNSKAEILSKVLNQSGDPFFYPSRLIRPISRNLIFLIDHAAATGLPKKYLS